MKTKTFDSFFGTKEVTKDAFIRQWLGTTHQYSQLFYGAENGRALLDFQLELEELAAKAWDNHK
jgi:hypothetical protein